MLVNPQFALSPPEGLRQTGDLQANSDGTASVIIAENKTFVSTSNDVTTYGMGVFGVESDSAEAKWTSLYIHKGTKEARSITSNRSSFFGSFMDIKRGPFCFS